MRVAHHLSRGHTGLFYFRMRVPADVWPWLRVRLIKRALGTRCPRSALALSVALAAGYARFFDAIRRGEAMAKPPSLEDILARAAAGEIKRYEITHPSGFHIRADGADDHRRAMEAMEHIGMIPMPPAPATSTMPSALTAARTTVISMSLADAIGKWLTALPGKNRLEKTRGAKRAAVEAFERWKQGILGKKAAPVALTDVSRLDCADWFIHLQGAGLNARTVENKFTYLAGFFDWTMSAGLYPKGDNPARGHASVPKRIRRAQAKANGWQAFSDDQIKTLFDPANYASIKGAASRWLPLMALYTGARSNELAHLELADCYDMPDGTPVLDFNLRGEHKSLKTEASERVTPVHPDLIALGLWERVKRLKEAGEVKLFPELTFTAQNGPANGPQRAFSRYLERLKIRPRGSGKLGLHSFRDTVINRMKTAGVRREMREEYTGHELSDRQEHAHSYELDFTPKGLAAACHPALGFEVDRCLLVRWLQLSYDRSGE